MNKVITPKLGGRYLPENNAPISDTLQKLGQILKHKRLQKNATQKELSDHSGVSIDTIKRGESGKPVSTENLMRMMKSLEMIPALLAAYKEPEISLEDEWELRQKKIKATRQRASKSQ